MKRFANWKAALIALTVFVFTTVLLPAFTTQACAADMPTPDKQAATAGAAGGVATTTGVMTGTIIAGVVVAATVLAVALSASSGDGTTTSHH